MGIKRKLQVAEINHDYWAPVDFGSTWKLKAPSLLRDPAGQNKNAPGGALVKTEP
jgi:hypothetical protein